MHIVPCKGGSRLPQAPFQAACSPNSPMLVHLSRHVLHHLQIAGQHSEQLWLLFVLKYVSAMYQRSSGFVLVVPQKQAIMPALRLPYLPSPVSAALSA